MTIIMYKQCYIRKSNYDVMYYFFFANELAVSIIINIFFNESTMHRVIMCNNYYFVSTF